TNPQSRAHAEAKTSSASSTDITRRDDPRILHGNVLEPGAKVKGNRNPPRPDTPDGILAVVGEDRSATERTRSSERRSGGMAVHRVLFLVVEGARPLAGGARVALPATGEVLIVRGDTRRIVRTREGEMTRV